MIAVVCRLHRLSMTRDQQIRKALQLLAPPSRLRAECLQDIKVALNRVEHDAAVARAFRVAESKKGKAGVRRYYAALRDGRAALTVLSIRRSGLGSA
jgi:hypothetical protein